MKMYMLTALAVLALTPVVYAAGPDASIDLVGEKAGVSFQCAMLAGHAGNKILPKGEPERLFEYGYAAAKVGWQALRTTPGFRQGFGPHFGFLAGKSDEFFIGMVVAGAAADIDKFLSNEVPIEPGVTTEQRMQLQGLVALQEFQRRNCRLIGK
ncbi:MAG: hypothetical protein WD036_01895 [Bauldia sp.]